MISSFDDASDQKCPIIIIFRAWYLNYPFTYMSSKFILDLFNVAIMIFWTMTSQYLKYNKSSGTISRMRVNYFTG